MESLKNSTIYGLFWKTLEQYGVIGVQFVLQIFLARILAPEHYGIIAIVNVFLSLSNVFIQNGLAVAIVQKRELDIYEISSVFWLSELIALTLYVILFISAPFIASVYETPILNGLIRLIGCTLFIGAYASIQNSLIRRELNFKLAFIVNVSAVTVSGSFGIILAFFNMGVWALALQQLLNALLLFVLFFSLTRWKPMIYFNKDEIKPLCKFGWKVLLTSLIDDLFGNYRSLFIGKFYSNADLSFYNRGQQFPNLIIRSINGAIQAVILPVMSKVQNNKNILNTVIRRSITCSVYLIFPILTGLAIVAPNLVVVLLTEKWISAVKFLRIFCVYYATWPMSTLNLQALLSAGKSGTVLRIEIFRKMLDLIVFLVTLKRGVLIIAIGGALVSLLAMPCYLLPCSKLTGYKVSEQFKDILPTIGGCIIMGFVIHLIDYISLPIFLLLLLQIVAGITVYYLYSKVLKIETLEYLCSTFRNLRNREG